MLTCGFLFRDFHIYAVDTIGHPGKSAEVSLSARNYDYGKWAGEVISGLGYRSIRCFGGSYGAGIIVKTMCAVPKMVERAVLYVPSGIKNAPAINSVSIRKYRSCQAGLPDAMVRKPSRRMQETTPLIIAT